MELELEPKRQELSHHWTVACQEVSHNKACVMSSRNMSPRRIYLMSDLLQQAFNKLQVYLSLASWFALVTKDFTFCSVSQSAWNLYAFEPRSRHFLRFWHFQPYWTHDCRSVIGDMPHFSNLLLGNPWKNRHSFVMQHVGRFPMKHNKSLKVRHP